MKTLKIVAMAAGVLVLAGCGNQGAENQNGNAGEGQKQAVQNQAGQQEQNGNGIVSSIKDAMGLGKTMRCTYMMGDADGGAEVVTYVDGKRYRTDMNVAGNKQHMIFDEEAMYSWSEGQKQGTRMTNKCAKELSADMPEGDNSEVPTTDVSAEDAFDSAMNVKCEPASGIDFSVPNDVTFTDQCEMLKNLQKNIPNMPAGMNGNMPENISGVPQL